MHRILVLDHDQSTRRSISGTLTPVGYEVVCCADGHALLTLARKGTPSCILIDLSPGDECGLSLLRQLILDNCPSPIFMMSETGDIPSVVSAIKSGAHDFIPKPVQASNLLDRVNAAIEDHDRGRPGDERAAVGTDLSGKRPLTSREQEVLKQLTFGFSNKEIGRSLGLSPRTIEGYRASIMRKHGARNAVELTRIVTTSAF